MPLQKYADTRFELRNLVTGKRKRMAGIMRSIMDRIRVRKSGTNNQKGSKQKCDDSRRKLFIRSYKSFLVIDDHLFHW